MECKMNRFVESLWGAKITPQRSIDHHVQFFGFCRHCRERKDS